VISSKEHTQQFAVHYVHYRELLFSMRSSYYLAPAAIMVLAAAFAVTAAGIAVYTTCVYVVVLMLLPATVSSATSATSARSSVRLTVLLYTYKLCNYTAVTLHTHTHTNRQWSSRQYQLQKLV
jgi:VIT1/CCC1 family predicted Fe2+/Mn2+ transporter